MVRVLSGMRPTGALHLGHYFGVLKQWQELQTQAECLFFVADWHALTTEYEAPVNLGQYRIEMVRDWLAAGIDPTKNIIFCQSDVKEHAELYLLLSMLTPVPWLERVPSYKDLKQNLHDKDLNTYGFLGYPLLQAADILMYQTDLVPVGEDQVAHLELAREVVRRFHHLYQQPIFVEPQARLTPAAKIPGTDGRKMSKSYQNAIFLRDDEKQVQQKVRQMITDPARVRRSDPGNPDICDVFTFHKIVTPQTTQQMIHAQCQRAEIGCGDCKLMLAQALNQVVSPIGERAQTITTPKIEDILAAGAQKARSIAVATMQKVRQVLGLR